jgi:hypothetical protein
MKKHWVDVKNVGRINAYSLGACDGCKRHRGVIPRGTSQRAVGGTKAMQANGSWCSQALQMTLWLRVVWADAGLKRKGAEDVAASAEATSGTPTRGNG